MKRPYLIISGNDLLKNQYKLIAYAKDLVCLIPRKFDHRLRLIKLYES